MLPQNHELYQKFNKSFHNVTFSNFAAYVRQYIFCKGISTPDKLLNFQKHVMPNVLIIINILKHLSKQKFFKMNSFVQILVKFYLIKPFQIHVQLVILIVSN